MPSKSMKTYALEYARERGWPVFPIKAGAKVPLTQNGVLDATTDPTQIKEWWDRWPEANIAVSCGDAGLLVVDVDPGADLGSLVRKYGLDDATTTATTPRGGRHMYYELDAGEIAGNSQSTLAEHVDTRSFHGYVLLPPSETGDGKYAWLDPDDPIRRPDVLLAACNAPREKSAQRDEWIIEPDLPENVALAASWLRGDVPIRGVYCRPAIEGQGGDRATFAAAAMMKSCGLSFERALDTIAQHFNVPGRCDPPWDFDALTIKVENAYRYNTSQPGNVTTSFEVAARKAMFQPVVNPEEPGELRVGRFRFLTRDAIESLPPPSWLVPDFLPEAAHALLVGHSGSYKSFVALDVALSVALGSAEGETDALWPRIETPGPVLYIAGEGHAGIGKRIRAWERYYADGDRVRNFILSDPVPRVLDSEEVLEEYVKAALSWCPEDDGYRLVVLDTVGRSLQGANENEQAVASSFTAVVDYLRRELNAAVLCLHHTGRGDPTRARGSSVFDADADTVVVAEKVDERLTMLHMPDGHKQKDAPAWSRPIMVELPEVRVSPDGERSLVARRSEEKPQARTPKQARQERAERAGTAETLARVAEAMQAILRRKPIREYSGKGLAEMIQTHEFEDGEGMEITAGTIRTTWLERIKGLPRDHPLHYLKEKYDPTKQVWRW